MEHVAIMRKSWGLTQKILSGKKVIESRWYSVKCKPWGNIQRGEKIYFKDSGAPATVLARVDKVVQFADLTPDTVRKILNQYGDKDGIDIDQIPEFFDRFKNKKYCILIFLKNSHNVHPFRINKAGFGSMSAWITVKNLSRIKC